LTLNFDLESYFRIFSDKEITYNLTIKWPQSLMYRRTSSAFHCWHWSCRQRRWHL